MYQIITEIYVDGKREMDSVYTKIYSKRGFAERNARSSSYTVKTEDGRTIKRRAYVRPVLNPVTREEAKAAYCKSKHVYVDDKYGQAMLTPSGHYGSHAPAEVLFYRSIEQNAGCDYDGNFYVEFEKEMIK